MTLPVAPMKLPANLAEQPNGKIDPSLMVALHPRGSLHVAAARAWKALVAECGKVGLPLTFTYGGMYRTYDEQYSLFISRYTTAASSTASRKWWDGRWWFLKPGMAMAAVPGTSNHGLGLAIDCAFDTDPRDGLGPDDAAAIAAHPQFNWFRDNISRFGFSFEVQSEPWHIRYVAGDALPQAVKDYEQSLLPTFPPFDPEKGKFGLWPIAAKPAVKMNDEGDVVRYLQGVLLKTGHYNTDKLRGRFGTGTERAVRSFQKDNGLTADGWVGQKTWKVIDQAAAS